VFNPNGGEYGYYLDIYYESTNTDKHLAQLHVTTSETVDLVILDKLDSASSTLKEVNLGDGGAFYTSRVQVRANGDTTVDDMEIGPLEITLAPNVAYVFDDTVTITLKI